MYTIQVQITLSRNMCRNYSNEIIITTIEKNYVTENNEYMKNELIKVKTNYNTIQDTQNNVYINNGKN